MEEREHKALKTRIVLKDAEELTQGDVDRFMAEFNAQAQGNSIPEDNGKTVRAALKAGWITEITEEPRTPESVDTWKPARVRWYAMQIDRVYVKARTIPNE